MRFFVPDAIWSQVNGAAKALARTGKKPGPGTKLPPFVKPVAARWISDHLPQFRSLVADYFLTIGAGKYRRMRTGGKLAPRAKLPTYASIGKKTIVSTNPPRWYEGFYSEMGGHWYKVKAVSRQDAIKKLTKKFYRAPVEVRVGSSGAAASRRTASLRKTSRRSRRRNPAPDTFYEAIVKAGIQHTSHESDLYVPNTPVVREILKGRADAKQRAKAQRVHDVASARSPWRQPLRDARKAPQGNPDSVRDAVPRDREGRDRYGLLPGERVTVPVSRPCLRCKGARQVRLGSRDVPCPMCCRKPKGAM